MREYEYLVVFNYSDSNEKVIVGDIIHTWWIIIIICSLEIERSIIISHFVGRS